MVADFRGLGRWTRCFVSEKNLDEGTFCGGTIDNILWLRPFFVAGTFCGLGCFRWDVA
jgi:hypothetical protein